MAQSQLSLMAKNVGTTLRLSVAGELDRAATDRFEKAFDEALEAATDRIVLDLSDVTFLDLGGLRTLLCAHARTRDHELDLTVVRPSGMARRIFTLTRAGQILALTDRDPSASAPQSAA